MRWEIEVRPTLLSLYLMEDSLGNLDLVRVKIRPFDSWKLSP